MVALFAAANYVDMNTTTEHSSAILYETTVVNEVHCRPNTELASSVQYVQ